MLLIEYATGNGLYGTMDRRGPEPIITLCESGHLPAFIAALRKRVLDARPRSVRLE
jgi:hypothetical protein